MRNPWILYGGLAFTGAMFYFASSILNLEFEWAVLVAVLLIIAVIVLVIFVLLKIEVWYSGWYAGKINPYMNEYKVNGDKEKYFAGIAQWEKHALLGRCKNVLLVNRVAILAEKECWQDCIKVLESYGKKHRTKEEKFYMIETMLLCYEKMQNTKKEKEMKAKLAEVERKYGKRDADDKAPATAYESLWAMLHWIGASIVAFIVAGFCSKIFGVHSDVLTVCILVLMFNMLVAVSWLLVWLVRTVKEKLKMKAT